jgi:hypothetical protein
MTDALASVDKSMHSSVASRELATISSDYATKNNRIYETRHQLAKLSGVFSAEISAIMHIQICLRG